MKRRRRRSSSQRAAKENQRDPSSGGTERQRSRLHHSREVEMVASKPRSKKPSFYIESPPPRHGSTQEDVPGSSRGASSSRSSTLVRSKSKSPVQSSRFSVARRSSAGSFNRERLQSMNSLFDPAVFDPSEANILMIGTESNWTLPLPYFLVLGSIRGERNNVVTCPDMAEALESLTANAFDLIVMAREVTAATDVRPLCDRALFNCPAVSVPLLVLLSNENENDGALCSDLIGLGPCVDVEFVGSDASLWAIQCRVRMALALVASRRSECTLLAALSSDFVSPRAPTPSALSKVALTNSVSFDLTSSMDALTKPPLLTKSSQPSISGDDTTKTTLSRKDSQLALNAVSGWERVKLLNKKLDKARTQERLAEWHVQNATDEEKREAAKRKVKMLKARQEALEARLKHVFDSPVQLVLDMLVEFGREQLHTEEANNAFQSTLDKVLELLRNQSGSVHNPDLTALLQSSDIEPSTLQWLTDYYSHRRVSPRSSEGSYDAANGGEQLETIDRVRSEGDSDAVGEANEGSDVAGELRTSGQAPLPSPKMRRKSSPLAMSSPNVLSGSLGATSLSVPTLTRKFSIDSTSWTHTMRFKLLGINASDRLLASSQFNIFEHEKADALVRVVMRIFEFCELPNLLRIDEVRVERFVRRVQETYHANPYHTFLHACDVLQTTFSILVTSNLWQVLDEMEVVGLLVGALCHDLDHPGVNEAFLIQQRDPLSYLYNDSAVLENHHVSLLFRMMRDESGVNILTGLSEEEYTEVREVLIDVILATNMKNHFGLVNELRTRLLKKHALVLDEQFVDPTKVPAATERRLLLRLVLHTTDISNMAKPWPVCVQWARRVLKEFFAQGDRQREKSLPISPLCDRDSVSIAQSQVQFIDYVGGPLFEAMSECLPELKVFVEIAERNRKKWNKIQVEHGEEDVKKWLLESESTEMPEKSK